MANPFPSQFVINCVRQPTHNTCVSACIAMLLDLDVNQVVKEFHDMYCQDPIKNNEFDYLEESGIGFELPNARDQGIYGNDINYLWVPSLNIEGWTHAILVDSRDGLKVYDPVEQGKLGYTLDPNEASGDNRLLKSWFLAARINPDNLRNKR